MESEESPRSFLLNLKPVSAQDPIRWLKLGWGDFRPARQLVCFTVPVLRSWARR